MEKDRNRITSRIRLQQVEEEESGGVNGKMRGSKWTGDRSTAIYPQADHGESPVAHHDERYDNILTTVTTLHSSSLNPTCGSVEAVKKGLAPSSFA